MYKLYTSIVTYHQDAVVYLNSRTKLDLQHTDDVCLSQQQECFAVDLLTDTQQHWAAVNQCHAMAPYCCLIHTLLNEQFCHDRKFGLAKQFNC